MSTRTHRRILLTIIGTAALLAAFAFASRHLPDFGFGQEVGQEVIDEYVIHPAVLPDGSNLPEGSGTIQEGAEVYANRCAHCHGETGTEGPYNVLVATEPIAEQLERNEAPVKAIGNYWPYATSVFDYTKRAMPFDNPGSLSNDEVYAVVAWLLHQNEIVPEDAEMNQNTLPQVEMPARDIFVPDPRPFPPDDL